MAKMPDIFESSESRIEKERRRQSRVPDVDIRPWHQKWFGWMFPKVSTFETAGAVGSTFTAILVTLLIVSVVAGGFGYGVGYLVGPFFELDPHNCGMGFAILFALGIDTPILFVRR